MFKYLVNYANNNKISFHMPGHKGSGIYKMYGYESFVQSIMDCDITEITGADNLFQPEGIIKEVQDAYERLYEVKKSFLLVNGTTAGILASVMASVAPGKKLLMSRGCHKSVYNAVKLGSIEPVYVQPQQYRDEGIIGVINPEDVEKALKENSDIEAVILPSPNYYGICSDVEAISEIVHRYNKILIIDQAHGAHLKFFHKFGVGQGIPKAAEDCGADIVINSIHKTLASYTQSAVLNVVSDRVDIYNLFEKLQMVQSTSPSYILMASLAINSELIEKHGEVLFGKWKKSLEWFYENASEIQGLHLIKGEELDPTKINIDLSAWGITGKEVEEFLMNKMHFELCTGDVLMAMTGIGNKQEHFLVLLDGLKRAIDEIGCEELGLRRGNGFEVPPSGLQMPHGTEKEEIFLKDSEGRVCASNITPYPPGIPFSCEGEEITGEIVNSLQRLIDEGHMVCGVTEENKVCVYKGEK